MGVSKSIRREGIIELEREGKQREEMEGRDGGTEGGGGRVTISYMWPIDCAPKGDESVCMAMHALFAPTSMSF